ncbi:hypothetical protein ACLI4U_07830 [Natrialbaceae archaeon A-CW2]|uniref:hypothetical protein n=1 Tax=Natronosalvus amylolyticus TaxID=2961994 RepID=UPI0020CA06B7|nr:hypothetical protein [Natronosalvus amylolyticus]
MTTDNLGIYIPIEDHIACDRSDEGVPAVATAPSLLTPIRSQMASRCSRHSSMVVGSNATIGRVRTRPERIGRERVYVERIELSLEPVTDALEGVGDTNTSGDCGSAAAEGEPSVGGCPNL